MPFGYAPNPVRLSFTTSLVGVVSNRLKPEELPVPQGPLLPTTKRPSRTYAKGYRFVVRTLRGPGPRGVVRLVALRDGSCSHAPGGLALFGGPEARAHVGNPRHRCSR